MSFRINSNISGLNAQIYGNIRQREIDLAMEKLSSGLRINRAADDASGMVIANQLRAQHSGLNQAIKNANNGIGLVKIADGALEEYQNILVQVRDKASQAASDTESAESRAAIANDIEKLLEQAQNIVDTTSYNGITLLDGSFTGKKIQAGAYSNQTIDISIGDAGRTAQGIDTASIDVSTQAGAMAAMDSFDAAIDGIDSIRSGIGSTQIQLESTIRNLETTSVNVKAAESQIREANLDEVQADLNKSYILAQTNLFTQTKSMELQAMVLNLLR